MIQASICTIGDEILIGQIVDTNSSRIASALEGIGVRVTRMVSFGDDRKEILECLEEELRRNDIVVVTGGLGPTKDDITKSALAELSGSRMYVENSGQLGIIEYSVSGKNNTDISVRCIPCRVSLSKRKGPSRMCLMTLKGISDWRTYITGA